MAERIKNIPSPDILMNSLRSIGYSFKTALADIIDNSISVNAKNIWIDFPSYNSDNLYITILDDAVGMDDAALFNAMKYGSERDEYGDKDLGRFGVGLKSASLSQCRMLTVMSKFDSEVHAYRWDLDEVLRSKEWECLRLDSNEIQACPNYEKLNLLPRGTMVIWQNFDIAEQKANGHAYEYLSEKLDESESHLCLIFHRFMNRSTSPVSFIINGRQLKGLDPFLHSPYLIPDERRCVHFVMMTEDGTKVNGVSSNQELINQMADIIGEDIFDIQTVFDMYAQGDTTEIGRKCYNAIKRQGEKLEDAASKLFVSVETIKSWNRNGNHFRCPKLENIIAVSKYTNIKIQDLLN